MIQTDICIVGAGPAGAAAALKLSYLGIPCVLVEKAKFPRDKVCGDAIGPKVLMLLGRLDTSIRDRFETAFDIQLGIWGLRLGSPNGKQFDVPFNVLANVNNAPGCVSKRMDFDHFLVQEVQRRANITYLEETEIVEYQKNKEGYLVRAKKDSIEISCKLLLVANGAYSAFTRHHAGFENDPKHYAAAVRAYYKYVKPISVGNFIELYFLKDIQPGYFWIFPLPNGYVNVGLGMRSDHVSKKKVNLSKSLQEIVSQHPEFKARFENAQLEGKVLGYGLPLGSKKRTLSGDHYLLLGDAGHLIDPLSGEGIGNAVYSGFIAAEQAKKCLEQNNFSASFLADYDTRVDRVLRSEMKISYLLQRMLNNYTIANIISQLVAGNPKVLGLISLFYADVKMRTKIFNPLFWIQLLRNKQRFQEIIRRE
ncbi:MAG: geranylgeranyl reductase family protein [Saprospiraceae bacterium]|nr:geranylgeranyl reductase family protein [Saprospiraceae bacterium]